MKANLATIGVNGKVKLNVCGAAANGENDVDSIAVWAQKAGKATGIVTTTRITHASPAGTYAHVANRDFECDTDVGKNGGNSTDCRDIASQLVLDETGKRFNVILGGGWRKFLPTNYTDKNGLTGERSDGVDLISVWKATHKNGKFVSNKKQLNSVDFHHTDHLFGLFAPDHMSYNLSADREKEPSLREMTESAIKILSRKKEGYFLFVEGGRIDHGHHETKARKALDETVQFSDAIQAAVDVTDEEDTLIIVTADHAHTMSISGYPSRGNDILGISNKDIGLGKCLDKLSTLTISSSKT